jgi:hypothetical protein
MATKTVDADVKLQKEALFKLILKKTKTKEKELMDFYKQTFIVSNLDILTPSEKKQFSKLSFR